MPFIAVGYNIIGNSVYKRPEIGLFFDCKNANVLDNISSEMMDFNVYSNLDKMKKDITVGKIDSGFVFDSRFDNAMESLNFENSVEYIVSKSSVLNDVAGEFIYKSMLEYVSTDIADKFFKEKGMNIQAGMFYDRFINSDKVFDISFEKVDSNDEVKEDFKMSNIFAVFVFIGGIICSINIVTDRKNGIHKLNFLYIFTSVFWLMLSALVAIALCGEFDNAMIPMYILYAFTVTIFSYVISYINNREIICGILPILVILAFILSTAVFDIGSIDGVYSCANYILPTFYFVHNNIWLLLAYTGVLGILALILNRRYAI